MAGVTYQSPHKLRHGHVVYGIKNARSLEELKAISQNVMHSSVVITDKIYGNLVGNDVAEIIARLGRPRSDASREELRNKLIDLLLSEF